MKRLALAGLMLLAFAAVAAAQEKPPVVPDPFEGVGWIDRSRFNYIAGLEQHYETPVLEDVGKVSPQSFGFFSTDWNFNRVVKARGTVRRSLTDARLWSTEISVGYAF